MYKRQRNIVKYATATSNTTVLQLAVQCCSYHTSKYSANDEKTLIDAMMLLDIVYIHSDQSIKKLSMIHLVQKNQIKSSYRAGHT